MMALNQRQQEIYKYLTEKHELYQTYHTSRTFLAESYRGGPEYYNKTNFPQREKETGTEYSNRLNMATRENFTRQYLDKYLSPLFGINVVRNSQAMPEMMQEFYANAGGPGITYDTVKNKARWRAGIDGIAYIGVFNPPAPEISKHALCQVIQFKQVIKGAVDGDGNFIWLHYVLDSWETQNGDFGLPKNVYVENHFIWDQAQFWQFKVSFNGSEPDKMEELAPVPHEIGFIPIFPLYAKVAGEHDDDTNPFVGTSDIEEVALTDRQIAIYWSLLNSILHDQGFSTLVVPVSMVQLMTSINRKLDEMKENSVFLPEELEKAKQSIIEIGTNRILPFPEEAKEFPRYISPDAAQADIILKAIEQKTQQLGRSTGQTADFTANSQKASGESKWYDHQDKARQFEQNAKALQELEIKVVKAVLAWANDLTEVEPNWIDYPLDYTDDAKTVDLATMNSELSIGFGAAFEKEAKKRYIGKKWPNLDPKVKADIEQEIDQMGKKPDAFLESELNVLPVRKGA